MGRLFSSSEELFKHLLDYGIMEPLIVNEIYDSDDLSQYISRESYYQLLSRLVNRGRLGRISKGSYYIPTSEVFSHVNLTDDILVDMFTAYSKGIEVGEILFSEKKIMLSVPQNRKVYTSLIKDHKMTVNGIFFKRVNLAFSVSEKATIEMLEVLENYYKMGDINHGNLISMYLSFIRNYDDNVARKVLDTIGYTKSTIDFLKTILDAHRVPNTLAVYLSRRSKYKHPTIDELKYMADWDRRNLKRRKIPNQTKGI